MADRFEQPHQSEPSPNETRAAPETLGAIVRETFRAMVRRIEKEFDGSDLVLSQWLALKLISSGKIGCVGDVCRELALESGATTRLVDHLEAKGLIRRCRSEIDRRVVGIYITAEGTRVVQAMQPRLTAFWEQRLTVFEASEQQQLFLLLSRLRDCLAEDAVG